MALTIQSAAALVPGAALPLATRRVRVVRPFMYAGEAMPVDELLDVPATFASELVCASKAAYVEQAPAPAAEGEA